MTRSPPPPSREVTFIASRLRLRQALRGPASRRTPCCEGRCLSTSTNSQSSPLLGGRHLTTSRPAVARASITADSMQEDTTSHGAVSAGQLVLASWCWAARFARGTPCVHSKHDLVRPAMMELFALFASALPWPPIGECTGTRPAARSAASAFDVANVARHLPVWGLDPSPEANALVLSIRAAAELPLGASGASRAARLAAVAAYSLCWDAAVAALVWAPLGGERSRGGPSFALRPQLRGRGLLVECPHPIADGNGAQCGSILARADPRAVHAVLMSGHHRCVETSRATPCDGRTRVCSLGGTPLRYPLSDDAHSSTGAYHAVHVALFAPDSTVVVGLHGMDAAGVSLSDGTLLPASADSHVATFGRALGSRLPLNVTACNRGSGLPFRVRAAPRARAAPPPSLPAARRAHADGHTQPCPDVHAATDAVLRRCAGAPVRHDRRARAAGERRGRQLPRDRASAAQHRPFHTRRAVVRRSFARGAARANPRARGARCSRRWRRRRWRDAGGGREVSAETRAGW